LQWLQFAVCCDVSSSHSPFFLRFAPHFVFVISYSFLNGCPQKDISFGPFCTGCGAVSFLGMSPVSLVCWTVLSPRPFSLPLVTKISRTRTLPICLSSLRLVAFELTSPSCEPQIWQPCSRHKKAVNQPEMLSALPGHSLCPPHSC